MLPPTLGAFIVFLQLYVPREFSLHRVLYILSVIVAIYPLFHLHQNQRKEPRQKQHTAWLASVKQAIMDASGTLFERMQKLEIDAAFLRVSKHGIWMDHRVAVAQEKALLRFRSGWSTWAEWLNDTVNPKPRITARQSQRLFQEHFSRRLLATHGKSETFSVAAHSKANVLVAAVRDVIGKNGGVIGASMTHGCVNCTHLKQYASNINVHGQEDTVVGAENLPVPTAGEEAPVVLDDIPPGLPRTPAQQQRPPGSPRGYVRMAVMDGKTITHRICAVKDCTGPLVNYKNGRFCEQHLHLVTVCGISTSMNILLTSPQLREFVEHHRIQPVMLDALTHGHIREYRTTVLCNADAQAPASTATVDELDEKIAEVTRRRKELAGQLKELRAEKSAGKRSAPLTSVSPSTASCVTPRRGPSLSRTGAYIAVPFPSLARSHSVAVVSAAAGALPALHPPARSDHDQRRHHDLPIPYQTELLADAIPAPIIIHIYNLASRAVLFELSTGAVGWNSPPRRASTVSRMRMRGGGTHPDPTGLDLLLSRTQLRSLQTYAERGGTWGATVDIWACGCPIGWGKCYVGETPSRVLRILNDIWADFPDERPSFIAYDDACSLLRHIVTQDRNSLWITSTKLIVDAWHYVNHQTSDLLCRLWCNPAPANGSQPDLISTSTDANGHTHTTRAFNTETAEQLNAWLNGFEAQLRQMSDVNYDFYVHVLMMLYKEECEERVAKKGLGLDDEFWDSVEEVV
ncbi:hypothetical protein MKEN_00846700 [Mycena kentingensis (nom. inval.)]|nr:hypothetical protein MKEN_00846700 [Mycena kentingensis (nom. inval.)]